MQLNQNKNVWNSSLDKRIWKKVDFFVFYLNNVCPHKLDTQASATHTHWKSAIVFFRKFLSNDRFSLLTSVTETDAFRCVRFLVHKRYTNYTLIYHTLLLITRETQKRKANPG